jgi:serine-type D-Ala-D-Ala carboxypeptidase (penicillin-binding protein 5/6)
VYRVRRRRALLVAALALALAYTAFVKAGRQLDSEAHALNDRATAPIEGHRAGGSTVSWPAQGQAALLLGNGRPAASPHQQPAAIASLAKVMTAYLTLRRYPLTGSQAGFTVTITGADAQAEADDVSEGQSGVGVHVGERLTERQLLEALLIPSGNNIAEILGDEVAGSQTGFVAEMNAEARALGMSHTLYTDPSGFDPNTVSTAADQLRIFRQAFRSSVFRQIISMASVTLPVAGTLPNFNPLVADGYAGKTGSDSAAGGCLAFFTHVMIRGRPQTAVGVVMGQGVGSDTSEILTAAAEAAQRLVASATQTTPREKHE